MNNVDDENLETGTDHNAALGTEFKEPMDKALVARLVVGAIIVALFVIFAVQNTASVTIEFLSFSFQLSQFLMMVLSAVAGVLIWEFAGAYSRRAKKKRS